MELITRIKTTIPKLYSVLSAHREELTAEEFRMVVIGYFWRVDLINADDYEKALSRIVPTIDEALEEFWKEKENPLES